MVLAVALPGKKDIGSSFKRETIRITVKTHPWYIIARIRDLRGRETCFFVRKKGHFKADCYKFRALMNSKNNLKGTALVLVNLSLI